VCGIAGGVRRGGLSADALSAMARALVHRGPDGEGVERCEPTAFGGDSWQAGLAHRRLAVFDPSPAGAQPMTSRSGRTTLVLNGEIYNHPELRRRLPGFPWRTGTDTEVLVELLEREGPRALERANGMFALGAWDRGRGCLWLARDRLGIKPLFYRADKDGLVFASELRGLLAGPRFERRLDPRALSAYLDFGFVPAPHTILEGVAKLPPGALLEWSEGQLRITRWWSLPPSPEGGEPPAGWREGLYARLVDAVRLQLRSDVPIGCFLSGGVDSTLLAALAMRERGELATFSLSFPEYPRFDESSAARDAARRLGTDHRVVPLRARDVEREAPAIVAGVDEPFADSSLVPVYALSRAARERVTVALSGDGADELFAGYRRYGAARWLARWHRLPSALRRGLLEPALRGLRDDRATPFGDLARRVHKVLDADGLGDDALHFAMARIFGEAEKRRLAPALAECASAGFEELRERRRGVGGSDALDRQLRVDLGVGLPDDMLTKVDRASMAHGLEVRVPYLDHRLVEHAARLPSALKLRGGRSKAALLDVFGATLPRRVRRRAKWGFEAPLSAWLRGPLRPLVRDALARERVARSGLFDARRVGELVARHERGETDASWRIWSLVVVSEWVARHGRA
jgi:asparagine synthase (glutamine-hydrolysing)